MCLSQILTYIWFLVLYKMQPFSLELEILWKYNKKVSAKLKMTRKK